MSQQHEHSEQPTPLPHDSPSWPFLADRTMDFVRCDLPVGAEGEASPASANRYQVSLLHARGGLGEVYRAQDQELQRLVALKRLPERYSRYADLRERFRREAEITAGLEHPGIVPVYGMVTDELGRPAYAMRFIEGETLHHAVTAYYKALEEDPQLRNECDRKCEFRQLLHRFIDVCNTVAYAHSRGVIHRDIKPQNIMLGPFGETLLLDWGLAKRLNGADPSRDTVVVNSKDTARIRAPSAEEMAQAAAEDSADEPDESPPPTRAPLTQMGQAVGTPQYMSPEQAAGTGVSTPSDIYNLGATLYFILTGQPPIAAKDWVEAQHAICTGSFPPPGQVRHNLPRALNAICLKALAVDPTARYAGSLELAADLEKWLAHEPVSAWREPWSMRARRWIGHHRSLVTTGFTLLCFAVVGLAGALVAMHMEKEKQESANIALRWQEFKTQAAIRDLKTEQKKAERRKHQARTALDATFWLLIDDYFTSKSKLTKDDRSFLERILQCYQDFVTDTSDEFPVRVKAASAAHQVAYIHQRLGHQLEAENAFRLAKKQFTQLLQEQPGAPCCRYSLAMIDDNLGMLLSAQNRWTEAESSHREAVDLFRQLDGDQKGQSSYHRQMLSISLHNLGLSLDMLKRFDEADALFKEAGGIREGLAAKYPTSHNYQNLLAAHYVNLGKLLGNRRKYTEAAAQARLAQPLYEKLVKEYPNDRDLYYGLAVCLSDLGRYLSHLEQWQEAEDTYFYAMKAQELLIRKYPSDAGYALHLGVIYCNLAAIRRQGGNAAHAVHLTNVAEMVLQPLRERDTRSGQPKKILRANYIERTRAQLVLRAAAEAVKAAELAVALSDGNDLIECQALLSQALACAGQCQQAQALATQVAQTQDLSGSALYALACTHGRLASSMPRFLPWHRTWSLQAIELLRRAEQKDYFTTGFARIQLSTDEDFAALRQQQEFGQFFERVLGKDWQLSFKGDHPLGRFSPASQRVPCCSQR